MVACCPCVPGECFSPVDTCGQGGPEKEGCLPRSRSQRVSFCTTALSQLFRGFCHESPAFIVFWLFFLLAGAQHLYVSAVLSTAVYLFPWSLTRALFVVSPVPPLLTSLPLFLSQVSLGADECLLSLPPGGPCLWFGMRPREPWRFAFSLCLLSFLLPSSGPFLLALWDTGEFPGDTAMAIEKEDIFKFVSPGF